MPPLPRALAALLATPLVLLSCSERREAVPEAPASSAAGAGEIDAEELERLRALGYADFAAVLVRGGVPAVVQRDPLRSWPGYDLFSNRNLCSAQLLDPAGEVVREWRSDRPGYWSNVELLPEGDLLVTGWEDRGPGREHDGNYLLRLTWDGATRWKASVQAHHDVERTPDGYTACLTHRYRRMRGVEREIWLRDDLVTFLDDRGRVLRQVSIYDTLLRSPEVLPLQEVGETVDGGKVLLDLLHTNSLEHVRHEHLRERGPIYAAGNVLISMRHQDAVAMLDLAAGRVVWAWGRGEISGPHDATLLENGHVLLFDNGLNRRWSRVVEVDPLTNRIVWEYRAPRPEDFHSQSRGSAQRLPNGNTLIANSDVGEAFEVTPAGEIVWRFLNPNANSFGYRATIVRMKRYPAELVEPLLGRTAGEE